jgi:hypothetical protein
MGSVRVGCESSAGDGAIQDFLDFKEASSKKVEYIFSSQEDKAVSGMQRVLQTRKWSIWFKAAA